MYRQCYAIHLTSVIFQQKSQREYGRIGIKALNLERDSLEDENTDGRIS